MKQGKRENKVRIHKIQKICTFWNLKITTTPKLGKVLSKIKVIVKIKIFQIQLRQQKNNKSNNHNKIVSKGIITIKAIVIFLIKKWIIIKSKM